MRKGFFNKIKKTREMFESRQIDRVILRELYKSYVNVADFDSFVSAAEKIFPTLNCGLASLYLKHSLKEGKVIQGSYKGNNHTFLMIDKNTIVDITADQYGGPAIYIGPLISPWKIQPK